jgi:alcohol dehydrogenase
MPSIRVAQVPSPNAPFEIVERDTPTPGPGQVRVAVQACGICHSDSGFVANVFPDVTFPLVTGHEVAGTIDAIGPDVAEWRLGDRVAVGWCGGYCGHCPSCRAGDFITCENIQVPGWSYPGGFAEALVVPATALARVPDELTAVEAAPLACAGVTTYNALRRSVARAGDLVAVLGLGGLGHLGVQYAAALGFDTVAIARGQDKAPFATELGARHYIDSTTQDVAKTLRALGGARVVLATVTNADAMSATIDGLGRRGELVVLGVSPESLTVSPLQLINKGTAVRGHPSGSSFDTQETLAFSALSGVRARVETMPLAEASAAYGRMLSGAARFRMVLTMDR